jgi:hypothetical protein
MPCFCGFLLLGVDLREGREEESINEEERTENKPDNGANQ